MVINRLWINLTMQFFFIGDTHPFKKQEVESPIHKVFEQQLRDLLVCNILEIPVKVSTYRFNIHSQ